MRILGVLLVGVGCLTGWLQAAGGTKVGLAVALFAASTGLVTIRAATSYRFPQIFVVYFAVEALGGSVLFAAQSRGLVPVYVANDKLAPFVMTVCLFAMAPYALTYASGIRAVFAIADRYFRNGQVVQIPLLARIGLGEGALGVALIWLVIAIQQAELLWSVKLTYAAAAMSDAMQNYDRAAFWNAILVQLPTYITPYILASVASIVLGSILGIRWRRCLTEDYQRRWLASHAHYKMIVTGVTADNPDQRIQDDIPQFIEGSHGGGSMGLFQFSVGLIQNFGSLVTFSILLWILSDTFKVGGQAVPGLLFWASIAYAALTTGVVVLIGRSLTRLLFASQHLEADFRFSLARLREYSEQIALLASESAERRMLGFQMDVIIGNLYAIIARTSMLTTFNRFMGYLNYYLPYIILGGMYFNREVTLGSIIQAGAAFGHVNSALTYFITYFVPLARFRSAAARLTSFDRAIDGAEEVSMTGTTGTAHGGRIELKAVSVLLPNRERLSEPLTLSLKPGEDVILTGPSGSGKSTLFRLIAGIWPCWSGTVLRPNGYRLMVLPQKPYIPTGSLLRAVCYPAPPDLYDPNEVGAVMNALGLGALVPDLSRDDNWTQRLSGGEQQRLAVARALLARPEWLFLDEATSAQDRSNEDRIYALLKARLPGTTIVSIAHKERLVALHDRHIRVRKSGAGLFTLFEAPAPEPASVDAPCDAAIA